MTYAYGSNLDIVWDEDPRMLGIRLARYKFVSKMLYGMYSAVEVGAGDGWLSKVVRKSVTELVLTDPNTEGMDNWNPVLKPYKRFFSAAYSLDVLEHVSTDDEDKFIRNIANSVEKTGTVIIGTPSLESQQYASRKSAESHINCKTEGDLRHLMEKHFHCVYLFGMNDEVIHTGFGGMCHYRIALCNSPK